MGFELFCSPGTASDSFTWNSTRALQRVNVSIPGVYSGNVFLGAEMQGTTLHTHAYWGGGFCAWSRNRLTCDTNCAYRARI